MRYTFWKRSNYIRSLFLLLLLMGPAPCQAAQPEMVLQLGDPFFPNRPWAVAAHAPRAATTAPGLVQFWDTNTWELRRTIHVQWADTGTDSAPVALSPSGSTLAVVTQTGTLQIWDANAGTLRRVILGVAACRPLFSPSGEFVAAEDTQGETDFWNLRTGQRQETIPAAGECAVSPDGRVLAAVNGDNTEQATLWNVRNGRELHPLSNAGQAVWGDPIFSSDGRLVAANGFQPYWHPKSPPRFFPPKYWSEYRPRDVLIWDVHTGRRLFALHIVQGEGPPALSPQERQAVARFPWATRWTLFGVSPYWKRLRKMNVLFPLAGNTAVSPTYVGNTQTGLTVVNLRTGRQHSRQHPFADDEDDMRGGAGSFSADARLLVLDNQLWLLPAGRLIRALPYETVGPRFFLPRGHTVAVMQGRITDLWDWQSGHIVRHVTGGLSLSDADPLRPNLRSDDLDSASMILSPDGRRVVLRAGSPFGTTAQVLDAATNEELQTLTGVDQPLEDAIFSPDGRLFADAGGQGLGEVPVPPPSVRVWDLRTGALRLTVPTEPLPGPYVFAPSGEALAVADHFTPYWSPPAASPAPSGNVVRVINTTSGADEWTLDFGDKATVGDVVISGLVYSHDGRILTVRHAGVITLYDTRLRRPVRTLPDGSLPLAFSPDDRLLVTAAGRVWRVVDGRLLVTLLALPRTDRRRLCWLALTPSGDYAAAAGADRYIRWRVGGTLYPASRYAARFRRPDLVRRALAVP